MSQNFRHQGLDAEEIINTVDTLSERIQERFPDSGLHGISVKLLGIARQANRQARWIEKPIIPLRVGSVLLIVLILLSLPAALWSIGGPIKELNLIELIQAFESGINDVVLIAVAVFFIATLERRIKRRRALNAIHELRAIAHIIDMHQLTKDPARQYWESKGVVASKQNLTAFQLTRYLDYCSEMLSLLGKISVLYVQRFNDPVALSAVNEVESLTTGLSRKIWQKLMIIHGDHDLAAGPVPSVGEQPDP